MAAKKTRSSKTKRPARRRYWLFKSEPSVYSIDDLAEEPDRTTYWDGVRNYQARNILRDEIQRGDRVLFYHSNAKPMAVVGTAEVVRSGYPDHTAWDPRETYYDPKSDPENPRWYMVDVRLLQTFPEPVTREMLAEDRTAAGMMVLKRGARLSIQPVTEREWRAVHKIAGVKVL